ncbi:hypothetical protein BDW62DRAFT_195602, partial [Aspergillus aurantiobrunneus]
MSIHLIPRPRFGPRMRHARIGRWMDGLRLRTKKPTLRTSVTLFASLLAVLCGYLASQPSGLV